MNELLDRIQKLEQVIEQLQLELDGMPAYANPVRYARLNPNRLRRQVRLYTADINAEYRKVYSELGID